MILVLTIGSMPGYGQLLPFACAGNMESYGVQGLPNSVFFWEIEGGEIVSGQGNDTVVVRWNYATGTHRISVTEQTVYGCFGTPVSSGVDINAPVADIGDDAGFCEGDSLLLDARTTYSSSLSYLWSDNSTNPTLVTRQAGIVWVKITGADGCADYDSASVSVYDPPAVDLGKDTSLCGSNLLLVDAGDYSAYRWSTGDIINPLLIDGNRSEPEAIWVEVTDQNGCKGSDTLIVGVCSIDLLFADMPNTITPGDKNGQNDTWVIPHIEMFPEAVLEIYDRWGRLIFRTANVADNPWNGESMSGQEMPMDAYFFVLDLKMKGVDPITGYVNVIR